MENQTIIVKKIKKAGHGHHGGAWKVAFADFAVAMMAFFLLLWLLASTTKEEKAGLSEYFSPTTLGLAEGSGKSVDLIDMGGGQKISQGDDSKDNAAEPRALTEREIQRAMEAEQDRLESLMEDLKKAIDASQALKPFKDQLLLDITPEGLRIQIVDKENRPMFDSGSAELKAYTKEILHELAKTINTVPNRISLTGHTDVTRFAGRKNYSNWELSADRANASRRELVVGGLKEEKIIKVMGLASMVLFNKADPRSPINRRIAIIVMNQAAEKAVLGPVHPVSGGDQAKALIEQGEDARENGALIPGDGRPVPDAEHEMVQDQEPEPAAPISPVAPLQPIAVPDGAEPADAAPQPKQNGGAKPAASSILEKARERRNRLPELEEPDYSGMSTAERIRARAEWNKRRKALQGAATPDREP